jgi:Cu/Ag efflux protein CusF
MIRLPRWLNVGLALTLFLVLASPALADGKIKSVNTDDKQVVVTDKDGKDITYNLTDNAKIFLSNGKEGKLGDLKVDQDVSVLSEKKDDKFWTSAILDRQGEYKDAALAQGTIKSVSADQNIVTVADAKNKEWTYKLTDTGKVTLNDKSSKLSDLKDGDKVILIYQQHGDRYVATHVCSQR